jgi:pimeloyl-ACP methyl ester carboxylesterase
MLNRNIEHGLLEVLGDLGVGCIGFSALAQGLLTSKYIGGNAPTGRALAGGTFSKDFLSEENLENVRALAAIAERRGQSLAQMAIAWVLRDERVTSALIGARNVEQLDDSLSPDTWQHVQPLLDRPGNQEIQLALFYSYGSNPPHYPEWQEYFRKHQPPTLIVWGKNDKIFPDAGAYPYKRDLKNLEFHLFDTGHFALEEDGAEIAALIRSFLEKQTSK